MNTEITPITLTGQQVAERYGLIAIAPSNRGSIVKLHLLRGPNAKTVCGRYWASRHVGDERVTERSPLCLVCQGSQFDTSGTKPGNFGQFMAMRAESRAAAS